MKKYFNLLRAQRVFATLLYVALANTLISLFSHTAIFTLLVQLGAPVWAIGLAAVLGTAPCALLSPFFGALVDSTRPKRLLFTLLAAQLAATCGLFFVRGLGDLWIVFVFCTLNGLLSRTYYFAEMALFSRMLPPAQLKVANELFSAAWPAAATIGMALAGVYVYVLGSYSAFALQVALLCVMLAVIARTPLPFDAASTSRNPLKMLAHALVYLYRTPRLARLVVLMGLIGTLQYDALVPLLAQQYAAMTATALAIGYLNSTRAMGLALGPLVLSRWLNERTVGWFFIAQAAGLWLWAALAFDMWISTLGIVATGLCGTALYSQVLTMVQHECAERMRGRVISIGLALYAGVGAGVAWATTALYGAGVGLAWIIALMGAVMVCGAGWYFWAVRGA